MKEERKKLLTSIIVLLIIMILLVSYVVHLKKKNVEEKPTANITIDNGVIQTDANYEEKKKDDMKEKLMTMGERDRMEYYVSNFITLVESKKYEESYSLLYDEFKKNYFPTAGQFQSYAEKYFPSMASLDFTNIERNGDTYVLWVTITDVINGSKNDTGKEMNFVVRENEVNNIDLSFNVTKEE